MLQFAHKRKMNFCFVKWDDSTERDAGTIDEFDRPESAHISYRKSLSITRLNRHGHPPLSHGSSQKGRRRHGEKGRRERESEGRVGGGKEKERGLSASKRRFARSNTGPGRYTWPFNICISKGVRMCLHLSMCTFHIDRFLAVVRRRDRNARYRAQTVAFDTFLPRNRARLKESVVRKSRLDEKRPLYVVIVPTSKIANESSRFEPLPLCARDRRRRNFSTREKERMGEDIETQPRDSLSLSPRPREVCSPAPLNERRVLRAIR